MNKKKIRFKTDFLLPKNNFWVGMGSVLNISGNYFEYDYSRSDSESDRKALISDWFNVGEDFRKSKEKFKIENSDNLCLK